ncbi:MAG: hypothetical protein PHY12_06085, partial [Eubacteriales bacterium]|nr:hypothetical protein [Eubacteriales bacterium]
MIRKTLALICCLTMLAPAFAFAEQTSFSMAGFDGDQSNHDWNDNGFFTRMEARTGLTFTFDEYTDYAKWQAAKQKMFETGDLPDVLFKAALTTDEQLRYSESGQLI